MRLLTRLIAALTISLSLMSAVVCAQTKIGTFGVWNDGSGSPQQSHLVYATNAGVWWYFSLISSGDAHLSHVIKCYFSSGSNLATATWTAASDITYAGDTSTSQLLGDNTGTTGRSGGRSLGVVAFANGSTDVVHLRIGVADDGEGGDDGHYRCTMGTTTVTCASPVTIVSPAASQWQGPVGTGASGASTHTAWGCTLAKSTGNFIHSFGCVQDFELDASALNSSTADTSSTWTQSWNINPNCGPVGNCAPGTNGGTNNRPPAYTIDGTMTNQSKAGTFAPLASDVMLAIYSDGGATQPNLTNLRFTKSGANGSTMWTDQGTGSGAVFGSTVTQDQNDWCVAAVDTTHVYAVRRNSATQLDVDVYSTGSPGSWAATSNQPAALTGKTIKAGAGVMCTTDGTNFWVFVVDSTDNAIKYNKFTVSGGTWGGWTTLVTVDSTATMLSGFPSIASSQAGLVYNVLNVSSYDAYTVSLSLAAASGAPSRTLLGVGRLAGVLPILPVIAIFRRRRGGLR